MDILETDKGNTLQVLALNHALRDQDLIQYAAEAEKYGISKWYARSILDDTKCVVLQDGRLVLADPGFPTQLAQFTRDAGPLPAACQICAFRIRGESQIGCKRVLHSRGIPLEVIYETGYGFIDTERETNELFGQIYYYNDGSTINVSNTGGSRYSDAQFYVSASVSDGYVELSAKTNTQDIYGEKVYHPNFNAGSLFKHMFCALEHFSGKPLKGMRDSWNRTFEGGESSNFDTFFRNHVDYYEIKQAALSTFSGQLAQSRGWNKCLVLPIEREMEIKRVIAQFSNEEPMIQDILRMIRVDEVFDKESALDYLCIQEPRINHDTRLTIGAWYGNPRERKRGSPINAKYGLKLMDNTDNTVLAICGFDIEGDNIIINHTPQSLHITERNLSSQRDKTPGGFRIYMLSQLIELCKLIGISRLIGIGADNHEKVRFGSLPKDRANVIINQVFDDCGFTENEDCNWYLDLKNT